MPPAGCSFQTGSMVCPQAELAFLEASRPLFPLLTHIKDFLLPVPFSLHRSTRWPLGRGKQTTAVLGRCAGHSLFCPQYCRV